MSLPNKLIVSMQIPLVSQAEHEKSFAFELYSPRAFPWFSDTKFPPSCPPSRNVTSFVSAYDDRRDLLKKESELRRALNHEFYRALRRRNNAMRDQRPISLSLSLFPCSSLWLRSTNPITRVCYFCKLPIGGVLYFIQWLMKVFKYLPWKTSMYILCAI